LAQQSAQYLLEAVDELGDYHLGWVMDQEMDVVVCAAAFDEFGFEVATYFGEDCSKISDRQVGQRITTEFCDEDQVGMKRENHTSSCPILHVVPP
jgi:hypothetical protein